MNISIREIILLEDATKIVDRLIDACRPLGPLSGDRKLVADVSRKAKLLKKSLAQLGAEVMPGTKERKP